MPRGDGCTRVLVSGGATEAVSTPVADGVEADAAGRTVSPFGALRAHADTATTATITPGLITASLLDSKTARSGPESAQPGARLSNIARIPNWLLTGQYNPATHHRALDEDIDGVAIAIKEIVRRQTSPGGAAGISGEFPTEALRDFDR